MLCKKHVVEECNSSDCESCGLEIRIKQLKAELSRVCNWKWTKDHDFEYWSTDCGEDFCLFEGDTQQNHYIYCPKCGGHIIDSKALKVK